MLFCSSPTVANPEAQEQRGTPAEILETSAMSIVGCEKDWEHSTSSTHSQKLRYQRVCLPHRSFHPNPRQPFVRLVQKHPSHRLHCLPYSRRVSNCQYFHNNRKLLLHRFHLNLTLLMLRMEIPAVCASRHYPLFPHHQILVRRKHQQSYSHNLRSLLPGYRKTSPGVDELVVLAVPRPR